MLLLISFAMLSQRRIVGLITLFAWQGVALAASTSLVAWATGQTHLYYSAVLTVLLKVIRHALDSSIAWCESWTSTGTLNP